MYGVWSPGDHGCEVRTITRLLNRCRPRPGRHGGPVPPGAFVEDCRPCRRARNPGPRRPRRTGGPARSGTTPTAAAAGRARAVDVSNDTAQTDQRNEGCGGDVERPAANRPLARVRARRCEATLSHVIEVAVGAKARDVHVPGNGFAGEEELVSPVAQVDVQRTLVAEHFPKTRAVFQQEVALVRRMVPCQKRRGAGTNRCHRVAELAKQMGPAGQGARVGIAYRPADRSPGLLVFLVLRENQSPRAARAGGVFADDNHFVLPSSVVRSRDWKISRIGARDSASGSRSSFSQMPK